ncbi:TlpA disulfide reductase family protein [Noviherbaspirillum sp. ST9]|uniref:TlpA disulfide reductase family protein n=1 Tax=Noviherbaspirillum sp. ST9 TaxID=3401606 RepID=UPI003B5896EC
MPILSRIRTAFLAGLLVAASAFAADQPAPLRVEAEMLDGSRYVLDDSRGFITLLSFWSPDSLASRKCLGELQRFHQDYESRGVKVVAISTVNDAAMLRAFTAKRKLSLPVAMLGENNLGAIPEDQLPIVLVLDRDGKVVASRAGLFSYRMLEVLAVPPLMKPVSGTTPQ